MKFPLWFRYAWWVLLIVALTVALVVRGDSLLGSQPTPVDLLLIALLAALGTVPLFAEFKFAGLGWKQHLDQAKEQIRGEIADLRNEVSTTLDVSNRLTQQVFVGDVPPSDERLKREDERFKRIVAEALTHHGVKLEPEPEIDQLIDSLERKLILGRAALEREVRRVWRSRALSFGADHAPRRYGLSAMVGELASEGVIGGDLAQVIRDLYSVGSAAAHGGGYTPRQAEFFQGLLPGVLATLRSI